MVRQILSLAIGLVGGFAINTSAGSNEQPVTVLRLENNNIALEATPDIGGRVLSFSLLNQPNFLKIGEEVKKNPQPIVNAQADNIGYFGHEMWVGPQSAWWTQQNINAQRLAAKAIWPPDPYLILAKNQVVQHDEKLLSLQGPESPITGVQLTKTYRLLDDAPNSIALDVQARNIHKEKIAWDIWFNTRVDQDTLAYVPVASADDIRTNDLTNNKIAPLTFTLEDKIFSLDVTPPPKGKTIRRGKIFIQPSAGWIAAFKGDQAFIIQFAHQPLEVIHPEQGQVELYHDYQPDDPDSGLLELEVHAPYVTMAPDEVMQASERWTVLPYTGASTRSAHVKFLQQNASHLGLDGL